MNRIQNSSFKLTTNKNGFSLDGPKSFTFFWSSKYKIAELYSYPKFHKTWLRLQGKCK